MPSSQDENLQDAAILTRDVENVFRKLIRFLVGRISLVKLLEMIRFIYVEEAEDNIRAENPVKYNFRTGDNNTFNYSMTCG